MPWEDIAVKGVAWGPFVSVVISILKGWLKLPKEYIQPLNFILGFVGLFLYGWIHAGQEWYVAMLSGLIAVLTSSGFHETFGHLAAQVALKK